MECMTCSLLDALSKPLLESQETKRRILCDVAEGIKHLHSCGVVHRDIKPENVLMQIVDGELIGRAKVCDFGVSRKAQATTTATTDAYTRPIGTHQYMPPEAFSNSAQKGSRRNRDIWSFGVLMCVVYQPRFLKNIASRYPDVLHLKTVTGEFAKEVAGSAGSISWDGSLGELAMSCLSLNPKSRPRIGEVLRKLTERGAAS